MISRLVFPPRPLCETFSFFAGTAKDKTSSPLEAAARLQAKVLLIHGTSDDNVHMQNTMNFLQALIEARKPFELYLQPGQQHGFGSEASRTYLEDRLLRFVRECR